MENNEKNAYIPSFFAGRSVFITGATGFIGKVLVEKLLRSCPDIAEIFVLIRPKKGLNIYERRTKMLNVKLFDVLRKESPSSFDKIIPISGNIAVKDLELLPSDREILINKISIIFHIAASVRFDESLKDAIFNNTRSTRDICILAEEIKQKREFVALVHISSTYTQIDKSTIEEILYPSDCDWKKTIKIVESVDDDILKVLTAKYMGQFPNTYTFSKRLAEDIISYYSKSIPCVIIRPSIVISSSDEPFKGWIDNFNGPIGMLIGGGKGIIHVVWSDARIISDYIPVDAAVKVIIAATWQRGIRTEDKTVHVYNCSANQIKGLDIQQIVDVGLNFMEEIPLSQSLWKPQVLITKSYCLYYTLMLLFHIIPAVFLDNILKLFNKDPILLKLVRKIYVSNCALSYFVLNEWRFHNSKILNIIDNFNDVNKKDFNYLYKEIDVTEYFKNAIIGAKMYLLNEGIDAASLEATKYHYKRMKVIDIITKTVFVVIVLWIFYYTNMRYNYVKNIFSIFI